MSASPGSAFGDRVHAGRRDVAKRGPGARDGEDRTGCGGEIQAAVADHELDPVRMLTEVGEQVGDLLSGPFPSGVGVTAIQRSSDPGEGCHLRCGRTQLDLMGRDPKPASR